MSHLLCEKYGEKCEITGFHTLYLHMSLNNSVRWGETCMVQEEIKSAVFFLASVNSEFSICINFNT